jgi:hypothetical protein
LKAVSCELALEPGAANGRFPWEELVRASITIQLVNIGLVISVDLEHDTGIDNIAPSPTTFPVTEVGQTTVLAVYKKNEYHQSIHVYVYLIVKKELIPFFSSTG